jgi:hypothetical protein
MSSNDLPPDRASVDVTGTPDRARFPALCARCGAPPAGTLGISKLHYRSGSWTGANPGRYLVLRVEAPFCARCLEDHSREARPIPAETRRRLLYGWAWRTLPYALPLAVISWFLVAVSVPELVEALAPGADPVDRLIWGGVTAFFALLAVVFLWMALGVGHLLHTPMPATANNQCYALDERGPLGSRLVVPTDPTAVTRAVDFEGDESRPFEGERHRFSFANHDFAAQFAALNADQLWDPSGERARVAGVLKWAVIVVLAAIGLFQLLQ